MLTKRGLLAGALAALVTLVGAAGAHAATITVGSPMTVSFISTTFGPQQTVMQANLPETGAYSTSPVNGRIISWKVLGATGGPLSLRVMRPLANGAFTGAGTSVGIITGTGLLTYQTNLPVRAGDYIGINSQTINDRLGANQGVQSAFYSFWQPPLADGDQGRLANVANAQGEWAYNAQIDPNCAVPNLIGKKLKAANSALSDANCNTGKVKGKKKRKNGKKTKVKSQSQKAGADLAPHTAVDLKLR